MPPKRGMGMADDVASNRLNLGLYRALPALFFLSPLITAIFAPAGNTAGAGPHEGVDASPFDAS